MYCNRKFMAYTTSYFSVTKIFQGGNGNASAKAHKGFALMASVVVMTLLTLLAVGILGISTVEMRAANITNNQQIAQANARLALNIAIGELQVFMGPDQRVSAPSSILEKDETIAQPHWVGVWNTRRSDGSSHWVRDDLNGGLRDRRFEEGWEAEEEVMSFLVSGNEGGNGKAANFLTPRQESGEEGSWVTVVGEGSLGEFADLARDEVNVPKVAVVSDEGLLGDYAYWVGDLGVRANVATPNAWAEGEDQNEKEVGQEFFPLLASQEVDVSAMTPRTGDGIEAFKQSEQERLVSDRSLALLNDERWSSSLWHEVTTWSQGVLADVRDGGLQKDLTVFLNDDGSSSTGSSVLSDHDNLVGPRNAEHAEMIEQDWESGRYQTSAPTFGMLRDWAQNSASLAAEQEMMRNAETESIDSTEAGSRSAFANDEVVKLTSRTRTDLKPVVVEGSMFSSFSYHPNPVSFRKRFNIRRHQWPRVVLWNPYNVDIEVPESVMMMQLNSRNDFQTRIRFGAFLISEPIQWISWGGGTRTPPPQQGEAIVDSANYNDPYAGMRFFSLPKQVIPAGECFVYSTEAAAEYDNQNVLANRLSAEVAPDPSRNFYISSTEFDDDDTGSGFDFEIVEYFYHPARDWVTGRELDTQADDARMIWKDASGHSSLSIFEFDALPQLHSVSCSLQYGAGREPAVPLASDPSQPIQVELTSLLEPSATIKPDVRSREGFRFRWFEEHDSNTGENGAGYANPVGSEVFDTAPIANWNLRASFSLRSPWSNITGDLGDGTASGPWFFGTYTRDLYDPLVGWDEQIPFLENGFYRGNPFGLPQEGNLRNILFEVPREETGVLSLAQFQHTKLSEFIWHPSYAVGNSLVDPRLGEDGVAGTAPRIGGADFGGWNQLATGWSENTDRSEDSDEWARFARFIMSDLPEDENLVYDLSYEVNHALWDEFFLSSGSMLQRQDFVEDGTPLPNGRMRLINGGGLDDLNDLQRSASKLLVDGMFNINSTNVEAWKALLTSTRQSALSEGDSVPFPRNFQPVEGEYLAGRSLPDEKEAWGGFRSLDDEEVALLAEAIVEQVKLRGPFLSLSDFVNRRLSSREASSQGDAYLMGPLQAAIESAGLNLSFSDRWRISNSDAGGQTYDHPDNIQEPIRISQELKPDSKAWGAPGYLTQADILQVIGSTISARSDTFLIRSYGDAKDASGRVTAKAWCEAVVQRMPEPIAADETGLNPNPDEPDGRFGRKFRVKSFRWLSENEV